MYEQQYIFICNNINAHTHTHTHIYIYSDKYTFVNLYVHIYI